MRVRQRYRSHRFVTNRLKILRLEHQWTQADVAKKMGLPSKFPFWQIENDERLPTFKERAKLAKIFGVHESEVFPALVEAPKGPKPAKVVAA